MKQHEMSSFSVFIRLVSKSKKIHRKLSMLVILSETEFVFGWKCRNDNIANVLWQNTKSKYLFMM